MSFLDLVSQARAALQTHGRVSVRGLGRELGVEADELDEIVEELVEIQQVAELDGKALIWLSREPAAQDPAAANAGQDAWADGVSFAARAGSPSATAARRTYTPKHLADKILASRSAMEGEKKQVTVLFCDVANSMGLADALGPEAWHETLNQFFEVLTATVHEYEGTVNQYTGDGIMALFGAPIAAEDHARRACMAALAIQEKLAGLRAKVESEHGEPFAARIGINSGEVVVGKIGDDLRMDYTAQGQVVGIAARLESLAQANGVLLSAHTRKLVEGFFELRSEGHREIKGVAGALEVFQLAAARFDRTRLDVARERGFSKFVGRSLDVRVLESAVEQTQEGAGQVIGVMAPAGTGKSRLCVEFLQRCESQGMERYVCRGAAHGRNISLMPILQLFRACFGIQDDDADLVARQRIEQRMQQLDAGVDELAPLVFDFLGRADPERPAPRLDPELRQRQLLVVMQALIRERTAQQTVLVMVEDLHWLDAASDQFLAQLLDTLAGAPNLLILLNFRPEYRAAWMGLSWYRQIALTPLDRKAVAELVGDLLGSHQSLTELAKAIYEKTAGNPFFAEEVAQSLIESGQLVGARGAYQLVKPIERLQVPDTVQAVLAARIDKLPDDQKQLLQTAAVIGKDFSAALLAAVTDTADAALHAALQDLQQLEFIREQASYPALEFTFKHPLTQEVALNSQLREARRKAHATVARAIEQQQTQHLDEQAALLAHHWEEAGESLLAAQWNKRAAEWAGLTNATEGLRHWQRVRHLLHALPRSAETRALGTTACVGALGLAWRLGISTSEMAPLFEEGLQLAEEAGDLLSQATLHAVYGAVLGLADGASDDNARYGRMAARLADQTDNESLQLAMRAYWAYGCLFSARLQEGLAIFEEIGDHLRTDPAFGAEFTGFSPLLGLMHSHAYMLFRLGRLEEGSAVCDRAEAMAREHGDHEVQTWIQIARIDRDIVCADLEAAREHTAIARAAGEKSATPQARYSGLFMTGVCHRFTKEWNQAIAVYEQTLEEIRAGANRMFEGTVRAELALCLLGRGDLERAEQEALTAARIAHQQHSGYCEIRGRLALAQVLLKQGNTDVLSRIEETLDLAQERIIETSVNICQPELHECRAQLAQYRDDPEGATQALQAAHASYLQMGAIAQAERLAGVLG